jgi:RHS repeat-associated protein
LENKKGYNGNEIQNREFSDGSGLDVYDFNARTYDQQIGRFHQIDPLADQEGQEIFTPYHYCFNNPVLLTDPDGRHPIFPIARALWQAYRIYRGAKLAKEVTSTLARNPPKEVVINMVITSDAEGNTVAIPEVNLPAFNAQVKSEKIENIDKELASLAKSNRSLENRSSEHQQKLEEYQKDPDKFDNKGFLKNATAEQRKSIISKRVEHLKKEIQTFRENINKNNQKAQELKKQKEQIKTDN